MWHIIVVLKAEFQTITGLPLSVSPWTLLKYDYAAGQRFPHVKYWWKSHCLTSRHILHVKETFEDVLYTRTRTNMHINP